MGKSSLLLRLAAAARTQGKQVVLLDLQLLDSAALDSAEAFLKLFCASLSYQLKLPDATDTYWRIPLSNLQRCTAYLEEHLLPALGGPLVIALDEVDRLFDTPFRSDFFGMLRGWHNQRAASATWKQLDLVLVTSTEPYQFVANLNQSPFNVGQVLDLEDFTPSQVAELNQRHEAPLDPSGLAQLTEFVGGHPYLVRRALYLVAQGQLDAGELFTKATDDRGPFGEHLRQHLLRLHHNAALVASLQLVLDQRRCTSEDAFFRLHGAGLVRQEGRQVVLRCRLYADYFRAHLSSAPAPAQQPREQPSSGSRGANELLSVRERDVLRLLAEGLTNAQIATRLAIAPGTVNIHVNNIYGKLGVQSRAAATRYALDHGLIP